MVEAVTTSIYGVAVTGAESGTGGFVVGAGGSGSGGKSLSRPSSELAAVTTAEAESEVRNAGMGVFETAAADVGDGGDSLERG